MSGSERRETGTDRLSLDDVAALVRITPPQWSPDGSELLVGLVRGDLATNQLTTELWSIDIHSGGGRSWLGPAPGVHHARWWPDGSGIAFLAPIDGYSQILGVNAPGEAPRPITRAPAGVRNFVMHPHRRALAFAAPDPPVADAEAHNRAFEVGAHGMFVRAPLRDAHVWLLDEEETVWPLTRGYRGVQVESDLPGGPTGYAWSPDGRNMALLTQATPGVRGTYGLMLEVVAVDTGLRSVLAGPASLASPRFGPDGSRLVVLAPTGDVPTFSPNGVFTVSDDGLTPFTPAIDRDLQGLAWLPTGDAVVWGSDSTRMAIWVQPPGGSPRPLPLGGVHPVSDVAVSPRGPLAFVGLEAHRPHEIYVFDGTLRRVTTLNPGPETRRLGAVETMTWSGPDGQQQDGVLVLPPDFDPARRYPLVVSIHGGPMAAATEGWVSLRQLLAAQGWLVFCPNYRGSNHRGLAFQSSVLADPAEGPAADILAGIAALRARGIVDDARCAVTGWSYGGYLSAWIAATTPGWRAVVAGAPVVDWRDAYALSDLGPFFAATIGGPPWSMPAAYEAASPLRHLDGYEAPTLILACTGDERVPITNAYRLFSALRDRGTEVSFVAYPVSGHAPSDPVHQRDVQRRWVAWLTRHFG